ncbi:hypothetical protein EDB89DRAFT_1478125 [Lactarius sanguifluus]|nr:hypothetical protein EDB89DRAFT_1478125 [Lactarius sanguifluus]
MVKDIVQLSYLLEGTDKPFDIFISRQSSGDILKATIFDRKCRRLAPDAACIRLLKVNVDSNSLRLPLLRCNQGDEGVEEISPEQTISEIWRKPPPTDQIHLFVAFTNLPPEFEGPRRILEAAHIVYYQVWGENLDKLLQRVPDHGEFQYLKEEQIDSLGLGALLYNESALLIRKEYKVVHDDLRLYERDLSRRGGGVVVTGQPGIGKSCFLYYLLLRLLGTRTPVAFQVERKFVLFQETGVQMCGYEADNGRIIPSRAWALADSHPGFDQPCEAFFTARRVKGAWIVQTTLPPMRKWTSWHKEYTAIPYWMDVFSLEELEALGKILGLNTESLRDNYNSWGPCARLCVTFTRTPRLVLEHKQAVIRAAREFIQEVDRFDILAMSLASHRLIVARPTAVRQLASAEYGTNRLRGFISRAYAQCDNAQRLSFYKSIRGHPLFGSPARQMFEIYVLLWFWHSRAQENLPCTGAVATSPRLDIPACPENMKFFSKPSELQNMVELKCPICWVPTSQTSPSLDAFILTDDSIITLQIAISSQHGAHKLGFSRVYDNLPRDLKTKRPKRFHVFITDRDDNAKKLREQNLPDIPSGTHVYSAVLDVDQLDSMALITQTRVGELETARVSIQWLYTIWYLLGNLQGCPPEDSEMDMSP